MPYFDPQMIAQLQGSLQQGGPDPGGFQTPKQPGMGYQDPKYGMQPGGGGFQEQGPSMPMGQTPTWAPNMGVVGGPQMGQPQPMGPFGQLVNGYGWNGPALSKTDPSLQTFTGQLGGGAGGRMGGVIPMPWQRGPLGQLYGLGRKPMIQPQDQPMPQPIALNTPPGWNRWSTEGLPPGTIVG